MKNTIISILLIYILNMYEGWAVQGVLRVLVSLLLVADLSIVISVYERLFKDWAKKKLKKRKSIDVRV